MQIDIKENYLYSFNVNLLKILLVDRTTRKNIIWATDAYAALGNQYQNDSQIIPSCITGLFGNVIKPRCDKTRSEQSERIRDKAEVFTPAWVCNCQNNLIDDNWFGRSCVFNTELEKGWIATHEKIVFPDEKGKSWQDYVKANRLEITCGEAPYLVSRYDTTTGDSVLPLSRRIGLLDRKLRIVGEHTKTAKTWTTWAIKAIQSCYGFEFQGDSLLIARINVLLSFCEYHMDRWNTIPSDEDIRLVAEIASWNLWQMDGFTDAPPLGKPEEVNEQPDLFGFDESEEDTVPLCRIKDWTENETITYKSIKEEGTI